LRLKVNFKKYSNFYVIIKTFLFARSWFNQFTRLWFSNVMDGRRAGDEPCRVIQTTVGVPPHIQREAGVKKCTANLY
jgi:hypothetical protein